MVAEDKTLQTAVEQLVEINEKFSKVSPAQQSRLNDRWNVLLEVVAGATGKSEQQVADAVLSGRPENLLERRGGGRDPRDHYKAVLTVIQIFTLRQQNDTLFLSAYEADVELDEIVGRDGAFVVKDIDLTTIDASTSLVRRTIQLVRKDLA